MANQISLGAASELINLLEDVDTLVNHTLGNLNDAYNRSEPIMYGWINC